MTKERMTMVPAATWLACLLGATLGAGCQPAELHSARHAAQFVLAPSMVAPPMVAPPLPVGQAARAFTVRLHGKATMPTTVRDLANVQDGNVSGSPVIVRDVATGRTLAETVTYYDGSFIVDVAIGGNSRAVVVTLDLVERANAEHTAALESPVMLRAGVARMDVTLSPGTTALTAFLNRIAAVQASSGLAGGNVESELGSLIAVFEPEAQLTFAQLAEGAPEIRQAVSLSGFASGIQRYVGRLAPKSAGPRKQVAEPGVPARDGL